MTYEGKLLKTLDIINILQDQQDTFNDSQVLDFAEGIDSELKEDFGV